VAKRVAWAIVGREEVLGEEDVAVEGIEDVLPGADGVRAADADGRAGEEAADEVGDEAVGRPVAAADDVAGAGGGEGDVPWSGCFALEKNDWR
jgi:hypothetical protein